MQSAIYPQIYAQTCVDVNGRYRPTSDKKKAVIIVFIMIYGLYRTALDNVLVPTARLELAQLSPLPPQDSVSTNFTTSAI